MSAIGHRNGHVLVSLDRADRDSGRDEYQILQRHISQFTATSANGSGAMPDEERSRHELLALREHILSCPGVPATSPATSAVLARLDNQIKSATEVVCVNGGNNPVPTQTTKKRSWKGSVAKVLIRSVLLDIPLFILFATFAVSYSLLHVYDDYLTKLMDAATWRGTKRLRNEWTYYKRECLVEDITTQNIEDLVVQKNDTINDVVDAMMYHGMTLHSAVLSPDTTSKLREFVIRRNAELKPEEAIPLDGEDFRWSFAIGANEDPIVPVALREIATHPVIRPTLEELVGPNPAVVEITAITAAYGCENQGWHADVKPLGSAVKYSRTFTHSYSLFTTLQDTTAAMGATELCPGTHYCTNDLARTCKHFGSEASGGGVWKAGDSLLLNQMAWHRGSRHVDPRAEHRAVFIMTFISRPRFGVDNRQLSHGTYFHIRWDMWGHTMSDLLDAPKHMSHPLAAIRSVGAWKPPGRAWGWDWLTVACLRIANDQNGYTGGDFKDWIKERKVFGLPKFLWGPVSKKGGWKPFIRGTLWNCTKWAGFANFVILLGYLLLAAFVSWRKHRTTRANGVRADSQSLFRSALKRLFYTHGFVIAVTWFVWHQISSSEWAHGIQSGRLLRRPFPNKKKVKVATLERPTTIPATKDVLIGSRFDSRDIYSYNRFLDFHPGNMHWRSLVSQAADAFDSYVDVPILKDHIVQSIVKEMSSRAARFLFQNELGFWILLSPDAFAEYTLRALAKENKPVLRVLDQEIAFMLADCRYGSLRGTAMAQKYGQASLFGLQKSLFSDVEISRVLQSPRMITKTKSNGRTRLRARLFALSAVPCTDCSKSPASKVAEAEEFREGDRIEGNYEGRGVWFEGVVRAVFKDGFYGVEFSDGDGDTLSRENLRRYIGPLQEGDRVEAEFRPDRWFDGTITKVYNDRTFDVLYDDGDKSSRLKFDEIRRL